MLFSGSHIRFINNTAVFGGAVHIRSISTGESTENYITNDLYLNNTAQVLTNSAKQVL